jgi:hypothetical protein
MNAIKTYFKNLWAAVRGRGGVTTQGAPTDPGKPK